MKMQPLLLLLLASPLANAGPKTTPTITVCEMSNRRDTALDGRSGNLVPVGPDRWFVRCFVRTADKKEKIVGKPWYLQGDLGGYGYYAKFADAASAAYDATHPKQEEQQ